MKKLNYLDFEVAFEKSLEIVTPKITTENIFINEALGRVLSQDVICKKNLPAFNNSAMDGFAIKSSDAGKTLKINQTIFAGDKVEASLSQNECYKIMTGAKAPNDVDTIIPIENCFDVTQNSVKIPENLKKGANLRLEGEEQKVGEIILKKGEILTASKIAILASQGIVVVEVYKKISIAVLSTGNELKEPWQEASSDEIYNCNSSLIVSLLKEKGFEATYCGVIPDNLEKSTNFIKNLKSYDVVITTGGISMGDADFMAQAFLSNGLEVAYHGVNIKPGRAMMTGVMNETLVICLPGNPIAASLNTYLFVYPMLKKLQGETAIYHNYIKASNKVKFKTKQGRVEAVLGSIESGEFLVTKENKYGSGMITVLALSSAILVSSGNDSEILENQEVKIIEFNGRFLDKKVDILN
ncbi:molybdopterin molybdotransferase MoeA [Aliarcobacter butzleri]|uniref:molybdopterin molybdotransferase MoeA n=1 Tax=Aliarcobacter butzleri TaxID=28197 RepID=UPI001EDABE37|nr:molybdopterin molybdotransferase MoeA [Aliarcobacter butzleri]MCG3657203.1 molybdopterin molybdotransferase MoeA [Aliarcobacter butzleri]MDK2051899.1 molybdopterin molybdotransferase MoeA [Aliarcobacter butzleri]